MMTPRAVAVNPERPLRVIIPDEVREPCARVPLPAPVVDPETGRPTITDGQAGAMIVRQDGALQVCDAKRALAVRGMDLFNENADALADALRPRRWCWPLCR